MPDVRENIPIVKIIQKNKNWWNALIFSIMVQALDWKDEYSQLFQSYPKFVSEGETNATHRQQETNFTAQAVIDPDPGVERLQQWNSNG